MKKDITEQIDDSFKDITEYGIDDTNKCIRGVCLFGIRRSANNRIYTEKAIASLTAMAENSKAYINHPQKSELKERDGVRDLRDFCGVYKNVKRNGDKITADLYCTSQYFDLLADVARLQPSKVGSSLNARVYASRRSDGMESVDDIHSIKSFDIVSNAACTNSIFESAHDNFLEKLKKEYNQKEQERIKRAADRFIYTLKKRLI